MFAESMLETSWAQRARRSWTTLTSFGLQALIIGCLLLLPLWKTIGLPAARTVSTPISLGRVAVETAPAPRPSGGPVTQAPVLPGRLMQPSRIPHVIKTGPDDSPSGPVSGINTGIEGVRLPAGSTDGLLTSLIGTRPVLPTIPPPVARVVRISSMLEGNLIRRVQPVYPPLARTAHVQGSVVVYALISKAGTMVNVHAISGHPMLVPATIDAVSQWRYRPYILNSEPIEVETQITVNFFLAGN